MSLKQALRGILERERKGLENQLSHVENVLRDFDNFDTRSVCYVVRLVSLFERGEEPVTVRHSGSLKKAIMIAEENFRILNGGSDVRFQADYSVRVDLDGREYTVPEKFWGKYKKSERGGSFEDEKGRL